MRIAGWLLLIATMLASASGCNRGHENWVIGERTPLSPGEQKERGVATEVAERYVAAWINQDYPAMFALESRHTTRTYKEYRVMSEVWRTKGFVHSTGTNPDKVKRKAVSIQLATLMSGSQARIVLLLCVNDEATLRKLKSAAWPERVMLLRATIVGRPCGILMGKEHGKWLVLNQPGTLEDAVPKFWKALAGRK